MNNTNRVAEWYWDFIDANANMRRAEWIARQVDNGLHAAVNLVVFSVVLLAAILLAWHFDFHSTTSALDGLLKLIWPSLPAEWAKSATFVSVVTAIITVTPSLTENFMANLARADIMVIKVFVLGFSIFDMITDIPTTKATMMLLEPSIYALGPILGFLIYWITFFGLLLMATVGFQVSVAILGYTVAIYARKTFSTARVAYNGQMNYKMPKGQPSQPQQPKKQPLQGAATAEAVREAVRVIDAD